MCSVGEAPGTSLGTPALEGHHAEANHSLELCLDSSIEFVWLSVSLLGSCPDHQM